MVTQQTLEAIDQMISHYSRPVAVGQITTGTVQAKSPEEYALQSINTSVLIVDIVGKTTPVVSMSSGALNFAVDVQKIFKNNSDGTVNMDVGYATSSLSDIAAFAFGAMTFSAVAPEVLTATAVAGLALGVASLFTGGTNIDVTGIKNNLANILENTVGQFEGGINALMNNWQQYQDSGQSPLGFILDTSSQFGGTMKTTGLSLSLADLEKHNIKISDVTGVFSINNATFVNSVNGGSVNSNIILTSGMAVYDPLILDLDGDGVETVGLDSKVLFDHAADGTKNATGWVGKDDGLLVRDINNNGTIDTGRELLGDNTILNNGQKAKNAYEALADLDSNKDGVINNQDAKYSELKIWQDANQDGISQSSELRTLEDAGIASLKVSPTNTTTTTLINGNSQAATSTYTKTDGTTGISAGINFAGDEFVREFTTKVDTSQVASLPDMQASGSVRDLREASALSSDLATKLQTYANSTNRTSSDLDSLVKSWASTSSMQTLASGLKPGGHPAGGRGTNLTQEEIYKLNVLEKFTGYYGGVVNFKFK